MIYGYDAFGDVILTIKRKIILFLAFYLQRIWI